MLKIDAKNLVFVKWLALKRENCIECC